MSWTRQGLDNGYIQETPNGQTPSVPALATHRGELWCLWSDPFGCLYCAAGNNATFQTRIRFPDQGVPVMAELLGFLHAIIVRDSGEVAHYIFDDINQNWPEPALLNTASGFSTTTTPALVAFHNRLFLVFIQDASMYFATWTWNPHNDSIVWSLPQEVSGISEVRGIPAMFILDGELHVLCSANDEDREILGFVLDAENDIWNSRSDVSEGKAASGVSATSYGDSAFLAFQENGPDDTSHVIYVSEYKDGKWGFQEAVAGQTSADPPQLAVLNGRINCIFNTNDDQKELKWYSRPLLNYSLGSWMSVIPDHTLLSNVTIPGTHDSCACSNIPFVRTQYLSIPKQLEAGLRFLDLRCRVHSDGELYMYHGGIPINMPMYLKFGKIMSEIFEFFSKNGKPTETVLISINNDDVSGKVSPDVFYNAVKAHINQTPAYEDGTKRWITARITVTLGEARGKTVLLRRFHPDPIIDPNERIGIDLSGWLNNNPDFTLNTPDGLTVTLQDKWQYSDILPLAELVQSKFGFVSNMLEKAATAILATPAEEWFLNFMSAVGDPVQKGEIAESHWVAVGAHSDVVGKFVKGMNPTIRKGFQFNKTRYGIIAIDYPELPKDSDLISWLVDTNMR
ncbi:Phosphatidylinositol-specific phospholipase C [Hyphodiscus hymeniophilus]|uniref:Phosphatidylinositol-specific phospholipase C n=1 Tax=Hyphodiscus hymeniophilus TaxID=353542 RepID=A0A9P6VDP2_9HELO|nr:Phosphatidylinositol-specific phospholipase C [Hyphodiscus hymeniophilus]